MLDIIRFTTSRPVSYTHLIAFFHIERLRVEPYHAVVLPGAFAEEKVLSRTHCDDGALHEMCIRDMDERESHPDD